MSFEKHLPALADALRDVAASVGTDTMGLTLMFPNETTFSSNFHQDLGDLTKDPVLRDLLIRNSALRAAQAAVRADGVEKTAARLHLGRGEVEAFGSRTRPWTATPPPWGRSGSGGSGAGWPRWWR